MSSVNSTLEGSAEKILKVLEAKAFYSNRFLTPIKSLYPTMAGGKHARLPATMYIRSVLAELPEHLVPAIAHLATRKIVEGAAPCPDASLFRQIISECALESCQLTPALLYERAKHFLALQPQSQQIADQWIEKIIYTAIRKLTRERFVSVEMEEWTQTVFDVLMMKQADLVALQVTLPTPVTSKQFDYRTLLKKNNHG